METRNDIRPKCMHAFKASEPFDGFYECTKCGHRATKDEALLYWELVGSGLFAFYGWRSGELNCGCSVF